jgi:Domain of unknown function (DUF4936)
MSQASENWYVYYPAPSVAALPALRAMLQTLAAGGAVRARLEERVELGSTPTWMEVYEGIHDPAAFEAALSAAVRASGLPQELTAARRVERFRML